MVDISLRNDQINKINEKLIEIYKEEEHYWKKQNRQLWLSLEDQNTGYFHAALRLGLLEISFQLLRMKMDKVCSRRKK